MTSRVFPWLVLPLAVALWGCPDRGVLCSEGLSRCGAGCADFQSDSRHCGACDRACAAGEICQEGSCQCQQGAQACNGECVVISSDSRHCGSCEMACAANEVCEAGACKLSCLLGSSTQCGQSCVNVAGDPNHCGGCGQACENAQSCRDGICTYDVVAACMSNGQLTGLQAGSHFKGPNEPLGSGPAALGVLHDVVISADGIDNRLYQARLTSVGGHPFAQYPGSAATGAVPNQLLVEDPYIYVANAGSGTLQVLMRGGALLDGGQDGGQDGGSAGDGGIHSPPGAGHFPLGLQYATVAELNLGANTYPEGLARVGNFLYLPLYGGYGTAAAAAGQKVAKVDISDPKAPALAGSFDLSTLDLKPFDGGAPVARPYAITAHQGMLYVALNNLNPNTYVPEGPGLLAKIDPVGGAISTIELGPSCLNPIWVLSEGSALYVSCQGKAEYDPTTWALVAVEKTAVVVVQNDELIASWPAACPSSAEDGGTACLPIITSRAAISGGRLYVGDQNGGRIFVLEFDGGQPIEHRGYLSLDGGAPIQACAVSSTLGYSNVSDVIAVP